MMISKLYSSLATGGNYVMRAADLAINSRVTWLVTGTLTSWNLGWFRAGILQDARLEKDEESFLHSRADCLENSCREKIRNRELLDHRNLCENKVDCSQKECQNHFISTTGNHFLQIKHKFTRLRPTSVFEKCRPHALDVAIGGLYFACIMFGASGGGRIPVCGRMLGYAVAQAVANFLDTVVVSTFVIDEIDKSKENLEAKELGIIPTLKDYKTCSKPALMVALIYFGIRVSDGWFMAKMPINTPPFVSLARRLFFKS